MLPFKANYGYEPRTSLTPKEAKKRYINAKERVQELLSIYKGLQESAKLVQERIKLYYNKKRSKGPDLKGGDKVWLLYQKLKS